MYYTPNTTIFQDGNFLKAKDAQADLYGQTLHYGFGVFEGIRSYHTVNGVKIFKAHEHFERLKRSCNLIGLPFDYDAEALTQITYRVLHMNDLKDAYIRPLVYGSPNMSLATPPITSLMIAAWPWDKLLGNKQLRVCISSIQRPNPKSVKIEAKACGHYVNSIMASNEARQRGFDEALMMDGEGFVAEGPGANFFFEKDGVLYTPPLGNILPGITRQTVLDVCKQLDMPVVEKYFRPEELFEADGAFFCGTAAEIVGIESIEEQKFVRDWKGTMGAIIQEAYQCIVLDKSYSYVIV